MALSAPPELVGDGVADDTVAIQSMLDNDRAVYLPPPIKNYLISKPLRLKSGQSLRLDGNTVVRLADGAMQYLLVNDDFTNGNQNIHVSGGIWDGNNLTQTCDYHQPGGTWRVPFDPARYLGCVMMFKNVKNLRLEKLTIKDPETFGIHLGNVERFTVEDITFDYNLQRNNMDGVHVQGGCLLGRIANLKGNTHDDMVALNADDGAMFEITKGPISDIQIDGLFCTNGYTAVRLLSAGNPVKRVRISNLFGSFRFNGISFTHHNVYPGEPSVFEDIVIDGVFSAKQLEKDVKPEPWQEGPRRSHALVYIQRDVKIDNLAIQNLSRREWMSGAAPTFWIEAEAKVETLRLSGIHQVNNVEEPLKFFLNDGSINRLFLDGVVVREAGGKKQETLIQGKGTIQESFGTIESE